MGRPFLVTGLSEDPNRETLGVEDLDSETPLTEVDHKGAGFRRSLQEKLDDILADEDDGYKFSPREVHLAKDQADKGGRKADRRANRRGGGIKWTDARDGVMEE